MSQLFMPGDQNIGASAAAKFNDYSGLISLKIDWFDLIKRFLITLIKRLFTSSLLSAIRVVSFVYVSLLMFLLPILIPAYNSVSLEFLMMCSAYRLNKQGDSRQPCCTAFSILNHSVFQSSNFLFDLHTGFSGDR